jgi:hypothetical protein
MSSTAVPPVKGSPAAERHHRRIPGREAGWAIAPSFGDWAPTVRRGPARATGSVSADVSEPVALADQHVERLLVLRRGKPVPRVPGIALRPDRRVMLGLLRLLDYGDIRIRTVRRLAQVLTGRGRSADLPASRRRRSSSCKCPVASAARLKLLGGAVCGRMRHGCGCAVGATCR